MAGSGASRSIETGGGDYGGRVIAVGEGIDGEFVHGTLGGGGSQKQEEDAISKEKPGRRRR